MEGPGADSEEKHEPASDIDTVVVDSLKALDPKRPIREATESLLYGSCRPARQCLVLKFPGSLSPGPQRSLSAAVSSTGTVAPVRCGACRKSRRSTHPRRFR